MKSRILLLIPIVAIAIMLNNGLINRASTLDEAKNWALENLSDYERTSSFMSEKTMYDEYGNPVVVDVRDSAVVTTHWTGKLLERNDEWGKNWCFEMELISNGQVIKTENQCANLARNSFTGEVLSGYVFVRRD